LVERVAFGTLSQVAHGSAYVDSVSMAEGQASLALSYPFGRRLEVVITDLPDLGDECGLQCPLAVKVAHSEAGTECTVVDSRTTGPTRISISLAHALALAGAGVHTVVDVK
jgi:hypothetical protein